MAEALGSIEERLARLEHDMGVVADSFAYVKALLTLVPALVAVALDREEDQRVFAETVIESSEDPAVKLALAQILGVAEPVH